MRLNQAVLSVITAAALSNPGLAGAKGSKHQDHDWKSDYRMSHHKQIDSLADAAMQARKLVGTAVNHGVLMSDENYSTVLNQEFTYVTPENAGKWGSLQPNDPDSWEFEAHDELVEYAQDNNKRYRGHTLVWHSQAPSFVVDSLTAEELQTLINNHIVTTVDRYSGQIFAWDVVNEAISDNGDYRDSIFFQKLGKDYIANAFHLTHSLDPRARLYYNDYNIAGINAKSDAVYAMLSGLISEGVPVDGIGFQMHLTASSAPSYKELVENFRRFAALGLRVNISELDVRVADLPWDQTTKLAIQQQVYHRVVSACMKVRRCESVTTWGFTDAYSWVDSTFGADDPLPLDESYGRKPAYFGMVDGFARVLPDTLGEMPNLVANGQMETGLDGWTSWGGELVRITAKAHPKGKKKRHHHPHHGRLAKMMGKSALMVTNRTETWHSAVYDITSLVRAGQSYNAEAFTRIAGAKEDFVAMSVAYRCADESDVYLNLGNVSAKNTHWQAIQGQFDAPECDLESVSLYVEGPQAEIDLLVDRVSLRPAALVPDDTGLGSNIVMNSGFEEDTFGWFGFGPVTLSTSSLQASSGSQSALVSDRTDTWQGPATSLFLDAEPGTDYQLLAWVRMESGSAQINATVKASCADGDQYIPIASAASNDSGWSIISGTFAVPECGLSDLVLYFEGPAAESAFYLDEVYVRQILSSTIDNLVSNGDFENGLAGWSAWGGSLSVTSTNAHGGSQSALLATRTANWQGPGYDLTSKVVAGGFYEVNAWGLVDGTSSDTLNITMKTSCADGTETYHQLASVTANNADWTQLSGSITLPSCDLVQAYLYFDGPAAGVNIFLDDVVVTGEAASTPSNLVSNPDFESGLDGWIAWGGTLSLTSDAFSGSQAAILSNRTGTWQGPVYSLLGAAEAGNTYAISAWIKVQGTSSANVNITVKTTCDDGSVAYNWGGSTTATNAEWSQITGSVALPTCNLTEVSLYFDGPDIGVDTLLDDVDVSLSM